MDPSSDEKHARSEITPQIGNSSAFDRLDQPASTKVAISSATRCGWSKGTKVPASGISTMRALPASAASRSAYLIGKNRSFGAQARRIGRWSPAASRRLEGVALVHSDGHLLEVASHTGIAQSRFHPRCDQVGRDRRLGERAEGGPCERPIRKGAARADMPPGRAAMRGIALKIPGGKFSWVSQLVRTRRPIRSG